MGHNRGELLLSKKQNQSSFYPPSNRLTRIFLSCMLGLGAVSLPACNEHEAHAEGHVHQKIVVTNPKLKDVDLTEQFVCQIHSQRHIQVRALQNGYLEKITIKEGQLVKKGDLLFKVIPTLYQAKFAAESAEAELALLERNNNRRLFQEKVISEQMLKLYDAKLSKAQAKADLAKAELSFSEVKAYFDGIVDRQYEQQGSLVKEGDVLTTLSDNLVMWVYFNVPEKHYIQYMSLPEAEKEKQRIELRLADGSKFSEFGRIAAIEGRFNNQTGTIPFRADFPNPKRLLRHGMTGNVLIQKTVPNALVIPQRATFEILAKRYVYVVDQENVVRQREIKVQHELNDIYVVESGLKADDKFVYEGMQQVRDGQKLEYEFRPPDDILANQKLYSE